jgi:predicted dehydrogenase
MSNVRWGILGAAKFAREFMGPALTLAPGGHVAALATSDAAKAEPFRTFAPGLRVHGSYEALLADPEIDAVYIPLPNGLHVEWALKAMAAGKHVLCEKPMAMQSSDFDQLISARDAAGVLAAEAFMIVFHPQWQRARQLLAEGAIGRLWRIDGAFSFNNRDAGNIRNQAAGCATLAFM